MGRLLFTKRIFDYGRVRAFLFKHEKHIIYNSPFYTDTPRSMRFIILNSNGKFSITDENIVSFVSLV